MKKCQRTRLASLSLLAALLAIMAGPLPAARAQDGGATLVGLGNGVGFHSRYYENLADAIFGGIIQMELGGVIQDSYCIDMYVEIGFGDVLVVNGPLSDLRDDVDWCAVNYILNNYTGTDHLEAGAIQAAVWYLVTAPYGPYTGSGEKYQFMTDPLEPEPYDGWTTAFSPPSLLRDRAFEMLASVPRDPFGACESLYPTAVDLWPDQVEISECSTKEVVFTATVYDQYDQPLPDVTVHFATGGGCANVIENSDSSDDDSSDSSSSDSKDSKSSDSKSSDSKSSDSKSSDSKSSDSKSSDSKSSDSKSSDSKSSDSKSSDSKSSDSKSSDSKSSDSKDSVSDRPASQNGIEDCCEGGVNELTLKYTGTETVLVEVESKDLVFSGVLSEGVEFSFTGTGKDGKLGSNTEIYADGEFAASIHTSCSKPIYPGLVAGDFVVQGGRSVNGGELCQELDCCETFDGTPGEGSAVTDADGQIQFVYTPCSPDAVHVVNAWLEGEYGTLLFDPDQLRQPLTTVTLIPFSLEDVSYIVCRDRTVPDGATGCSHGYWKNHSAAWFGYLPSDLLVDVFTVPGALGLDVADTLYDALRYKGGSGIDGAARSLLLQAVASLLNAAHPDVDFGFEEADVIGSVNDALATLDRDIMLDLAEELDRLNNQGCGD